jgi:homoserine dehydrogenase
MKQVTLGLIGAGNIGQGVLQVLDQNADIIRGKSIISYIRTQIENHIFRDICQKMSSKKNTHRTVRT